ncbi:MAG: sugar transferase [Bacteroidales bacterium]
MKSPKTGLVITDLIILSGSYVFMAGLKPVMVSYMNTRYLIGFGVTLVAWMICSFYLKKYHIGRKERPTFLVRNIAYPNLLALAFVAFIIYAFNTTFYSRMMVFGTFGVATLVEMFVFGIYTYVICSPEYEAASAFLEKPPNLMDKRKLKQARVHSDIRNGREYLRGAIIEECGEKAATWVENHVNLDDFRTLVISTTTRFNILRQPENHFTTMINLRRVNDIQYLNKFFEAVNHKIPQGGTFIGCAETSEQRKQRILRKYPPLFNWIMYTIDYIIKRVFPKFYPTKKLYFLLTRGNNRVLSRAEILGRLYSCGFEVTEDTFVNGYFFFVTRRIKEPAFDVSPTYGPFVKLKRVAKGGELINVYKLRTMHPFAEYLQDYVHRNNNLQNGGKFMNDFRISRSRALLRRLWIDELPMVLNVFKGQLKLIGVRPLSQHYFSLYSEDLREKRIRYRPGLIPPFYADLPETLDEIQESERRYLESFDARPLRTQWRYFWKAMRNILFNGARSA